MKMLPLPMKMTMSRRKDHHLMHGSSRTLRRLVSLLLNVSLHLSLSLLMRSAKLQRGFLVSPQRLHLLQRWTLIQFQNIINITTTSQQHHNKQCIDSNDSCPTILCHHRFVLSAAMRRRGGVCGWSAQFKPPVKTSQNNYQDTGSKRIKFD
jgi:hypothetical protein